MLSALVSVACCYVQHAWKFFIDPFLHTFVKQPQKVFEVEHVALTTSLRKDLIFPERTMVGINDELCETLPDLPVVYVTPTEDDIEGMIGEFVPNKNCLCLICADIY
jgi:hypothetical protein